ncbi:ankyrin repeat domain-containing protein [uncultured Nonlabens sp.]|uniref:ankyrin repeat domain-containing protein n=1 Tax=uncultured Nonlabens sp. TaxID=859306 RepID=UPI00260540A1|nr:ankyrin repeat domain-containing protein [uncultured Nonlabens sp.]
MDYKASKNIFFLFSIISFLSKRISGIKEIPVLKIPLNSTSDGIIYLLYVVMFLFSLIHLIVERKNHKFLFELWFLILIFLTVSISKFWESLMPYIFELCSTIFVVFLIASLTQSIIKESFFIRSKIKSEQLNLPRIPSASLPMFIFDVIGIIVAIGIWTYISYNFLDWNFIIKNIIFIAVLPFSFFLILFSKKQIKIFFKISNWQDEKEIIEKMKKAFDNHDRDYQNMGLIKVKKSNSKSREINSYITIDDVSSIDKYYLSGKDPNEVFSFGFTSLMFASAENKINSVKKIIEHGANLNLKNSKGRTALCFASRYNHHSIVELLLEKGADPNDCSLGAETPLQIAAFNGNEESVIHLLNSEKINLERKTLLDGYTALDLAMQNGHGKIAKLLRKKAIT